MPEQLFDLYSVPIFSTLMPEKTQGSEIGSAKQVIKKGDVLLCKINPHLNRVWEITEDSDNVQIASSEWIVVKSELHHPTFLNGISTLRNFVLCFQAKSLVLAEVLHEHSPQL